jgi:chaperone protein EcpD
MIKLTRYAMVAAMAVAGIHAPSSEASVVINATRVIYPAQEKEVTVKLTNQGTKPALVQVWMDDGDAQSTPESAKVPFNLMPPIFRMDTGKGQAVRVVYTKDPLPTDKESLFWLNMLEIPPKADDEESRNVLQFAFRTRIKLFFRPDGLPGSSNEAPDKLSWKFAPGADGKGVELVVSNPSPYYVSFSKVAVKEGGRSMQSDSNGGMVAPGSSSSFKIKGLDTRPSGDVKAEFQVISDYGAFRDMEQPVAL